MGACNFCLLCATAPDSTRAVVQTGYGASDVLRVERVPVRPLGPTDVRVDVRAAALDRGTWHLMTGTPTAMRLAVGLRTPRAAVAGRDLAGVVVAVGEAVTRFRPGDEVHGTADGSFADHVVTAEHRLAPKPPRLTFEQAAAMPVSGLSAFGGLVDVARVSAGQRVLVTGASGGVGTFAVQIAAAAGADVTASCRAAAAAAVGALGATSVVDRTAADPLANAGEYDVVVDVAGRPPVGRLRRALAPRGTAVLVGGEGGSRLLGGMSRGLRAVALSPFVRQRLVMLVAKERGADLERLDELVERGAVTPVVDRVYPLDDVRAAIDRLVSGDAVGKIVLSVA